MRNKFTVRAEKALNHSLLSACELGHTYIGSEHLLLGLLLDKDSASGKLLEQKGITYKQIRDTVVQVTGTGIRTQLIPEDMTPRSKKIIEKSYYYATQTPGDAIGTEHLLFSLLEERDSMAFRLLQVLGVNIGEIKSDLLSYMTGGKRLETKQKTGKVQENSALAPFGKDLTAMANANLIDPVIAREKETERLIQILTRRTKNNPCLVGEPGVGKTAVVEGLAQRIANNEIPDILKGRTLFSLDLTGMIAGAKYRGEFEERMKTLMREIHKNSNIILFIDEIHTLIGAGAAEGAVDAANILKPALSRGEIQVIGATTIKEYRQHIEKDAALERRFQPIYIDPPNEEATMKILRGIRDRYESHHQVKIPDEALSAAVSLSSKYVQDRFLPDKAIDLLDETASKIRLTKQGCSDEWDTMRKEWSRAHKGKENAIKQQNFSMAAYYHDEEKRLENKLSSAAQTGLIDPPDITAIMTPDDVANTITEWTGIPVGRLTATDVEIARDLKKKLEKRVLGQGSAIHTLSEAILRNQIGMKDPQRPIGCFLFLGPTGVGKTELCRVLADELYGSENAMIRLNMSEYQESHSISKLIGSPPGYVGFDEGGQLTEKIRRKPYSLVLFDEIEKANPDIYNLLLQIMDDGVLTDSQGRSVSFKNALLILTSNLGSKDIMQNVSLGFHSQKDPMDDRVKEAVKNHFPPEFINRLDETVIFHKLSKEDCTAIAQTLLQEVKHRASQLGIALLWDTETAKFIADKGFDPQYGARPLKRTITKWIETPLADRMVRGDIQEGDTVYLSPGDGSIEFTKRKTT